jgi:hypothetical protein
MLRYFTAAFLVLLALGFVHELLSEPIFHLPGRPAQWLFITGWSLALLSGVWARFLWGRSHGPTEPHA